jgi:hypothetical protein
MNDFLNIAIKFIFHFTNLLIIFEFDFWQFEERIKLIILFPTDRNNLIDKILDFRIWISELIDCSIVKDFLNSEYPLNSLIRWKVVSVRERYKDNDVGKRNSKGV